MNKIIEGDCIMTKKTLIEVIQIVSKLQDKGITICTPEKDEFFTYSQLYIGALNTLKNLQQVGIKQGDELIFQLSDLKDIIHIFWGCVLGGITPVLLPLVSSEESYERLNIITKVLKNPKVIKCDEMPLEVSEIKCDVLECKKVVKDLENVSEELPSIYDAKEQDTALIQFSSGTMGTPKGIYLSHLNIVSSILASKERCTITPNDNMLSWLPLMHNFGMIGGHLVAVVCCSNEVIMPTQMFLKSPRVWMDKVNQYRSTLLFCPNFGVNHFLNYSESYKEADWDLSCIKHIFNASEPISYQLCHKFVNAMKQFKMKDTALRPAYGMSEASMGITCTLPTESYKVLFIDKEHIQLGEAIKVIDEGTVNSMGVVSVGDVFPSCELRICDLEDRVLESGKMGEIQIRGESVIKHYYENKEADEKAMTLDGWLRTGDSGVFYEGGLYILGRIKDIIFINGKNYYSSDIERVLQQRLEELFHKKEELSIVTSRYNEDKQQEELLIFIKYAGSIEDFVEVRNIIFDLVKDKFQLIANKIIPIEALTFTASGKKQRYKMVKRYENHEFDETSLKINEISNGANGSKVPSSSKESVEEVVLNICKRIIKDNSIKLTDRILELDVNSIKLTILASELSKAFELKFELNKLFKLNTVYDIAQDIKQMSHSSSEIELVIQTSEEKLNYYKASPGQRRVYMVEQLNKDIIGNNIGYNMPEVILLEGNLEKEAVNCALKQIIERHESLRTGFEIVDGEIVQRIYEDVEFDMAYNEISSTNVEIEINQFIQPFDLVHPPLMRVKLLKLEENKHLLVLDMHHIISDGWSVIILLKELNKLLQHEELLPVKVQFKDFAIWQEKVLASEVMKEKEVYWLKRFAVDNEKKIPILNIPTDYPRPSVKNYEGKCSISSIDRELVKSLQTIVMNEEATLHMIMLAAYHVLLSKYSGQDDIIIGSPIAGRQRDELQNTIGMFVNMLANRNISTPDMSFRQLLKEVKRNCLGAYENQEYQFDELVSKLKLKREMNRNPLFDYVFAVQNLDLQNIQQGDLRMTAYPYKGNSSRFDMFLSILELKEEVRITLEYSTQLFKEETIEKMIQHYIEILTQVSDNMEILLKDITLSHNLSEAKSQSLEDDFCF